MKLGHVPCRGGPGCVVWLILYCHRQLLSTCFPLNSRIGNVPGNMCVSELVPSIRDAMPAYPARALPPAMNCLRFPDGPQPDTALARPKFSLFKPSSELVLNKLREMRAVGRSDPPPAVCEVYRRSETGSAGPSSPLQERCEPEGATVVSIVTFWRDVAETQGRSRIDWPSMCYVHGAGRRISNAAAACTARLSESWQGWDYGCLPPF